MSEKSIFVVDDEEIIVSTVTAILNMSGFPATGFQSAEAALRATDSESPDLLVTDVSMPGMNGIELAIRFKSLCPNCKILLFSGHATSEELLAAARAEGHDFTLLSKPVHPKDLLKTLREL